MPIKLVDAVAGANAASSSADRLVAQEDAALVAGAKTGNARAFELLVQQHERKIFYWLSGLPATGKTPKISYSKASRKRLFI
jgi:hypothetical protein